MRKHSASPGVRYSVIVPAYNAQSTLPLCLDALSWQTVPRKEYEIIVVDDGSTDDTAKAAEGFDVRYFYQPNQGPACARNRGAEAARGAVILFTDSDCIPARDWIAQMAKPFEDPETVAVKGAYQTSQKELMARFAQLEFEDRYDLLRTYSRIDMIDTYSAAFRKVVFMQVGGFDTNFPQANNEDTELSYRLSAAGCRMVFNPEAIVVHRHPDNLIKYLRTKFRRAYWRMIVYRRFPKKAFKDSYTPKSLKLQTLLMALSLPFLLSALFHPALARLALIVWAAVIVSSVPFSLTVFKKDKQVGLIAPAVVFLRSAVFACGSILGAARSLFFPDLNEIAKAQ
ncbi:MAG: glycosyltransferase [Desulforhabdus sp.]|jgi:glycosyltransferase involved in cell wall biosynthesis|nr:glycosyltransferase [Desulforhabdus sp.]